METYSREPSVYLSEDCKMAECIQPQRLEDRVRNSLRDQVNKALRV